MSCTNLECMPGERVEHNLPVTEAWSTGATCVECTSLDQEWK